MIAYLSSTRVRAVLFGTILSCLATPAAATVVFEENFALRALNSGVFGSPPNITNTNLATYIRGPQLGSLTQGQVGEYAPGIKGLLFQPASPGGESPGAGGANQNMAVPYSYTFGTDAVRLTLVARQGQARWNNFVFGFVGSTGNIQNWLLLQTPSGQGSTSAQLFHGGGQYTTTVVPAINSSSFRTLVLEYNPTKVNTPGMNPYTFTLDGAAIPLTGSNLPGVSSISGIGWGFFFGDGSFDRTVLIQSMKFEVLTSSILAGDFNGNGVVDAADYALWRDGGTLQNDPTPGWQLADYEVWKANFGKTGGSGATATVPEPVSGGLLLIGLLAFGCTGRRRRHSPGMCGNSGIGN